MTTWGFLSGCVGTRSRGKLGGSRDVLSPRVHLISTGVLEPVLLVLGKDRRTSRAHVALTQTLVSRVGSWGFPLAETEGQRVEVDGQIRVETSPTDVTLPVPTVSPTATDRSYELISLTTFSGIHRYSFEPMFRERERYFLSVISPPDPTAAPVRRESQTRRRVINYQLRGRFKCVPLSTDARPAQWSRVLNLDVPRNPSLP